MRALLALTAVIALIAGCAPRDQFWKKPDFGREYKRLDEAVRSADDVRNVNLFDQKLLRFPDQILTLKKLERLALSRNAIGTLPDGIASLPSLNWLDLGEAGLTNVPPAIGQLSNLTTLYLKDNQLTRVPPELGRLAHLTYLNLDRNKLTSIPPALCHLPALKWLRLNGNQLTALPENIGDLSKTLQRLYLRGNPLPDVEKARIRKQLPNCQVVF